MNTTKDLVLDDVEVATTLFQLTKGLMFRKEGNMLLDFGTECRPGIWMLFMKYPLLLAFVGSDGRVTDVVKYAHPITMSPSTWKIFHPSTKIRYVLEVDARLVKKGEFDVDVGDELKIYFS